MASEPSSEFRDVEVKVRERAHALAMILEQRRAELQKADGLDPVVREEGGQLLSRARDAADRVGKLR